MSDGVTCEITGLAEMMAELQALPAAFQARIMKGAVATGCSVIRKEAILRAPYFIPYFGHEMRNHPPPGTLKKAIYQVRLFEECKQDLEVWKVDVRKGKKLMKSGDAAPDAYYASWIEYGHYTRTPKGPGTWKMRREKGRSSGDIKWVAPRPFMRPAFDAKQAEALQAMQQYIDDQLKAGELALKYLEYKGA